MLLRLRLDPTGQLLAIEIQVAPTVSIPFVTLSSHSYIPVLRCVHAKRAATCVDLRSLGVVVQPCETECSCLAMPQAAIF